MPATRKAVEKFECIRPVRAKCREESQMGDADVSCASSTTAKSKGGVLLEAMGQASLVNISETVITPREARSARTRANVDQRATRCCSGNLVFLPSRSTSR
jgi:hypothetical protein